MNGKNKIRERNLEPSQDTDKDDDYKVQLLEISSRINNHWHECEKLYLDIGRDLLKAKEIFGKHGKWEDWLKENVPFSVRQSQRLMRVAEWFGETTPVSFLGFSKAYILTRIPKTRLCDFLERYKSAGVDAEPFQVIQKKSKHELEDAVRKYMLSTVADRSSDKGEKIKVDSPKMSQDDHVINTLTRVEKTMSELVSDAINRQADDDAFDLVISEIRRVCEETLGKLPSEDVQLE